ncbi:MAG: potassium-transporting ATPase subunit KdpA [Ignavibacteriales bacterium]|nr:potassium-transporting ATPase subunit KdpA [Ignavibacteriales bacterium]
MPSSIISVILLSAFVILLAYPLGKYLSKVFKGEKNFMDFLTPFENFIFKVISVDPASQMSWKENMKAMLRINLIFYFWAYIILALQGSISFLNPAAIANMEATLAFNTAISFVTNTNLQHYSGETGLSYFSQLLVIGFLQFVSAATGIAAMLVLMKGLVVKNSQSLGNFYVYFVKSITRLLLPLSIIVAVILLFNGVPQTLQAPEKITNLEGEKVTIATGPVASVVAIKQVGTNGGGFFGTNSAHPFENANFVTNLVETSAIIIIPVALVFMVGFYLNRKKLGWVFFTVMVVMLSLFIFSAVALELSGNPQLAKMGLSQPQGNMEGKETRFGSELSALWGVLTTSTSNGSVNSMHDSHTPLAGAVYMFDMMVNAVFGGVGVGFLNFFLYVVIGVFISGLMVGRTPELLGKKIEAREVKIASLVILFQPLIVLPMTAIAAYIAKTTPDIGWLNNPGYHGFSEMLYEFTSAFANNGSGFEGLGDNTAFWNISTGLVMLVARFIPIIGPVAIAGSLAAKKSVPESEGSLKIDSAIFGVVLLGVIFIVVGLSFLPALALGPVAEYFSM